MAEDWVTMNVRLQARAMERLEELARKHRKTKTDIIRLAAGYALNHFDEVLREQLLAEAGLEV